MIRVDVFSYIKIDIVDSALLSRPESIGDIYLASSPELRVVVRLPYPRVIVVLPGYCQAPTLIASEERFMAVL